MNAVVYDTYGSPDLLRLEEIDQPKPGDDDVMVRVHAASVNSWDWDNLRGALPARAAGWGLFRPKHRVLGADIAGRVEAVGKNVRRFRPGDEVFGDLCECGWGGFAEYACASENALALKPRGTTFEQAAAIPQAGGMALQGVRDYGRIQAGQKVLINGAGGGVGTFAIQLAKARGAEVTGVDNAKKLDLMRSLGADHVIDYTTQDFARGGQRYDVILDVTAHRSMVDYARALSPTGVYVVFGGETARILQLLLVGSWLTLTRSRKKMMILIYRPNQNLECWNELFESGQVRPVIDRTYPLRDTAAALRRLGEGNVLKVVVTVSRRS
jgi:NADPH:quinone reductase-like Zn-dependent oxidoreductase